MVFSTSGSWMWRRTAARSHATARPTTIPPAPTRRNRPVAAVSENEPVTAAATAMRYATIAAASLIMLSPSRMVTRRRGRGGHVRRGDDGAERERGRPGQSRDGSVGDPGDRERGEQDVPDAEQQDGAKVRAHVAVRRQQ